MRRIIWPSLAATLWWSDAWAISSQWPSFIEVLAEIRWASWTSIRRVDLVWPNCRTPVFETKRLTGGVFCTVRGRDI